MAAELARHGIRCRIIDQLAVPLPYCRAIGVTPRTLEVWDDMGIASAIIDAGLWIDSTRRYLNHSPAQDTPRNLSDLPYGSLGIPQPETERILTAHLATFDIAVERPVTVTSFTQDSEGVHAELLGHDGTTTRPPSDTSSVATVPEALSAISSTSPSKVTTMVRSQNKMKMVT
jgi:2-polyprenyl-6-methoxyphenol hydroxylase-like FAD-dependent oxidoreductase